MAQQDRALWERVHEMLHTDPEATQDDTCPWCVADEIEAQAEAKWAEVFERGVTHDRGIDTITGILARGAGRKQDIADGLRDGTLELVAVEESKAGRSVIFRVVGKVFA